MEATHPFPEQCAPEGGASITGRWPVERIQRRVDQAAVGFAGSPTRLRNAASKGTEGFKSFALVA
jgi:hypothetical protein